MANRLFFPLIFLSTGCGFTGSAPEHVWGHQGVMAGELNKPRAVAIDKNDQLYIVDFTARIQKFDRDGNHLGLVFTTPDFRNGRPSGLGVDLDGNLIVADSHYHCFRIYSPDGVELKVFGGDPGHKQGQLGYVSDVVQDEDGCYYVSEFGENQRISKFDSDGRFIRCWGELGSEPGQFSKIRALALGPNGLLYAADSCNHRIQVFTRDGKLVRVIGGPGRALGQLAYPYDLAFGPSGNLYVVEYENGRVQKFTPDGESLGCVGSPGKGPGQLNHPWGLVVDSKEKIHVLDSENHRVLRFGF